MKLVKTLSALDTCCELYWSDADMTSEGREDAVAGDLIGLHCYSTVDILKQGRVSDAGK